MATSTRTGYTVTMFVIDISPSMGTVTTVDVLQPDGEVQQLEMTHLERAIQFVKLRIQDLIYYDRKTDQCGVILVGSEETKNVVNDANDGYDHILEYIPIGKPNAQTLAKLDALEPSTITGDPIDGLVVALETQQKALATKASWTRKVYLVTDAESPMEFEDWEAIVARMNEHGVSLVVIGVDFDDELYDYTEANKNKIKRVNENFYKGLIAGMERGHFGNLEAAIEEVSAPESKLTKSAMLTSTLRIGDVTGNPDEAVEIDIRVSKATSAAKPKSWKKFGIRAKAKKPEDLQTQAQQQQKDGEEDVDETEYYGQGEDKQIAYIQLANKTRYIVDPNPSDDEDDEEVGDARMKTEDDDEDVNTLLNKAPAAGKQAPFKVEREETVRGYKYGTTYVPAPEEFKKLPTVKGFDICGFFPAKNFRRELCMGEVSYIWGNPKAPHEQVKLSAIVKAMKKDRDLMAIARYVFADGKSPKMGVLMPCEFENVDCLLFNVMPFANDVRKYTFASLDHLVNKKGEVVTEHPYLPTDKQLEAMDKFVDGMDLSDVGEKDEDGNRTAWYNPQLAYNPALHRIKQAQYHSAVVPDIPTNPLPPPHAELTKFFEPPKRALKRAREAIEECKDVFNVRQVPPRPKRARKEEHVHDDADDDDELLLENKGPAQRLNATASTSAAATRKVAADDSATEDDATDDEDLLKAKKKPSTPSPRAGSSRQGPLPTPGRSVSPDGRAPGRIISNAYPLKDFRKNIAQGDIVSKAVEDLAVVVTEVVGRPFASRRSAEMIECMTELRKTCLEEDEIDAWNDFLTKLKAQCLSKRGNAEFWHEVQKSGTDLTLISMQEAKRLGGESKISENDAIEFVA